MSLPRPLSESLGLPDVFPHEEGCLEDRLTPEALQHGLKHQGPAADVGITPQRELSLTITDQPPGFYTQHSLAYWRQALRQQLQGPARQLAAKRKAHELFDVPLSASGPGSSAAPAPAPAAATAAGGGASGAALPPPRFPQQTSRGVVTREVAEAWARQQLASSAAPPLRTLGWGGAGGDVPHGFPRTRLFEMLAELAPPMPRALWFLRVVALNRTRPPGWDGASEAQQRSKQLTEELLTFLEASANASPAGGSQLERLGSLGRTPPPDGASRLPPKPPPKPQRLGGAAAAPHGMPPHWQYALRLAGHCCSAGLLDASKAAEWAASSRVLLPLPAAGRRQVLSLLSQCLCAALLAHQQVLALTELCLKSAEAAGAAAAAAASASMARQGGGQPCQQQAELAELRQGLLQAAVLLVELHPAAFVAAEEELLQPLEALDGVGRHGGGAQRCQGAVSRARRQLSRALHARVLHWHDAKAMQLLDEQLQAGSGAAEAAAALCKLVSQHPEAAGAASAAGAGEAPEAVLAAVLPGPLADATRLACEWAAAAPVADFGAALFAAAAHAAGGQQPAEQLAAAPQGAPAMVPERVLFALSLLQALAQQQQRGRQEDESGGPSQPPLQAAIHAWLCGCAGEQQQPGWRLQRVLHLALLLAEAGLLCPASYLRACLASGAFLQAGSAASNGSSSFHVAVLRQLHPLLDFPSLAAAGQPGRAAAGRASSTGGSSGGGGWALGRQQYASARAAVLAQWDPTAEIEASTASEGEADGAEAMEWEQLLLQEGPCADDTSSDGSDAEAPQQRRQQQQWQDPALQRLQHELLVCLGFAAPPAGAEVPAFGPLLESLQRLPPWQQRHTAHMLLGAAKAFLASTDAGGAGRQLVSPPPDAAAAAPGAGAGVPGASWLLQMLALLRACCAHREALSLLATCLNVLQRAVAAAVRAATGDHHRHQQGQQQQDLGEALTEAQRGWQQRSNVPPPLLLALLEAHAASLAAADIAAKLLPMLTGGLWRLQQAQQQAAARQALAGQKALAAELLALPCGGSTQAWLDKMRQQHGSEHWVVASLAQMRQAAAGRAGDAVAGATQHQLQQQGASRLQEFAQRARLVAEGGGSSPLAAAAAGAAAEQQGQPQEQQPCDVGALLQLDNSAVRGDAAAAALATVQHSLAPAALPGVLEALGGTEGGGLPERLLSLGPAAAAALLADPQQAHACLQHLPHHTAGHSGAGATSSWQLMLGLFGAAAADGAGSGCGALLKLSSGEAMAAAVAAATPATARCCWLLLRLLLDEQQWQGGHRLAEAERHLAARAACQAALRPHAAAALASALCSLSPSAAAGQQLLLEVESMLRLPVVDLSTAAQQQHHAPGRPPFHAAAGAAPAASTAAEGDPAAAAQAHTPLPPFAAEQGLVDAALVCLGGSSGERQLAFAQQLIRQLAALADALLQHAPQPPAPRQAQDPWGAAASHSHSHGSGISAAAAAAATASPAAVQVSVWLRLALLVPLVPLVYKHRAADAGSTLRAQLLRALLRLVAAPAISADAAHAAAAAGGGGGGGDGDGNPTPGDAAAAAAAAAASEAAGEPLPQRLLHLLQALVVGNWASWLRRQGAKMRDVPPFEQSRQLAAEAVALLPGGLRAAVQAALPLNQQHALAEVPTCRAAGAGAPAGSGGKGTGSGSSARDLDPWLLLEGGTCDTSAEAAPAPPSAPPGTAAAAAVPPWLEGAVKRRRRGLCYWPAPHAGEGPMLSIEAQLRQRGGYGDAAG